MEDPTKSTSADEEVLSQAQDTKEPGEGTVAEAAEGAEKEKVGEEASPRTYDEEEWNKRQSSIDKQIEELKKSHQSEITTISQQYGELIARERESQNAAFLKKVEEEGGNVDMAKMLIAREEAVLKQERENKEIQQYIHEEGKAIAAHKTATQYGIDEKELLKAQSPLEMENIALKLHAEKLKAEQKRPIKTDGGVSSAKGIDLSKMSPEDKIGWALLHQK